jgi:hypothetical protein
VTNKTTLKPLNNKDNCLSQMWKKLTDEEEESILILLLFPSPSSSGKIIPA